MKFRHVLMAAVVAVAPAFGLSGMAHAIVADPGLKAPALAQEIACRTVRTRIVGRGGRVSYRIVRNCTAAPRCSTSRQRVVRPNGTVVFKTVQRCR